MFGVNGHDNLLVIIPFSTIHFCVQTDNTTPRDSMLEDYTVRVIPLCAALLVGGLLFFVRRHVVVIGVRQRSPFFPTLFANFLH